MLCASLFGCVFGDPTIKIHDIRMMKFGYSVNNSMYGNVLYKIEFSDGVYTAAVKLYDVPDEEAVVFTVNEAFVRELETMLVSYDVGKWNGFNKSNKHVLDGNNFHMYIKCGDSDDYDKTYLSASGYHKWPKNYSAVRSEISALFEKHMPKTANQ